MTYCVSDIYSVGTLFRYIHLIAVSSGVGVGSIFSVVVVSCAVNSEIHHHTSILFISVSPLICIYTSRA